VALIVLFLGRWINWRIYASSTSYSNVMMKW